MFTAICGHASDDDGYGSEDPRDPSNGDKDEPRTELAIFKSREAGGAVHVHHKGKGYKLEEGVEYDDASHSAPNSSATRVCAHADENSDQGESSKANGQLDRITSTRPCGAKVFIVFAVVFFAIGELAALELGVVPGATAGEVYDQALAGFRQAVFGLVARIENVVSGDNPTKYIKR